MNINLNNAKVFIHKTLSCQGCQLNLFAKQSNWHAILLLNFYNTYSVNNFFDPIHLSSMTIVFTFY